MHRNCAFKYAWYLKWIRYKSELRNSIQQYQNRPEQHTHCCADYYDTIKENTHTKQVTQPEYQIAKYATVNIYMNPQNN